MNDMNGTFQYKGKDYKIVFNLNVMEKIQEAYGSVDAWADKTVGAEPNARAVIFGITEMINEGIDIDNEERDVKEPFLTTKQVGRMITEIGMREMNQKMQKTIVDSTKSAEKNE